MPESTSSTRQTSDPQGFTVSAPTGWSRRTWLLLVTLCGALFLDALDISMVGVALPSIRTDLGMDTATLQWIVSSYVLGYGGFLLLGGRASDLLGRRRVFLAAVGVFGVASVISALSSIDGLIIALRFVKGVSAAFTVPAGLSIITTTFAEGPARNKAFSIYSACGASGFSLGLVFGGFLTELSWRATLVFPGPVALLLLVIGMQVVPRTARRKFSFAQFDLLGALSSTASLLILVFAVVRAAEVGWGSAQTLVLFAISAVLAVSFVVTELRHPHPLLRLGVLRSVRLVHANVAGFVMFGGYAAFQFLVTLYVQGSLGWSPISMAMAFLPIGLIVVVSATKIEVVLDRFNTTVLVAIGLVVFGAAYLLFLRTSPGMSYWNFMFPTMMLLGIGFAILFPAINSQATAGVADDEQGLASGLLNTFIQVGGALMMAVVTAIMASSGEAGAGELLPGMGTALIVLASLTAAGLLMTVVVLAVLRGGPAAEEGLPGGGVDIEERKLELTR
ncbi:MFS transporter [Streptomyces sp. NPDC006355]|uniref:MFS transporter n=1 Tax=Streptomyces sp. NPDC006355 TaxID=3156758 RepID=UPI0033B5B0B9